MYFSITSAVMIPSPIAAFMILSPNVILTAPFFV
jgi:hypothetical protein